MNCPKCDSLNIIKKGNRRGMPLKKCKDCGHRFVPGGGRTKGEGKGYERAVKYVDRVRKGESLSDIGKSEGLTVSAISYLLKRYGYDYSELKSKEKSNQDKERKVVEKAPASRKTLDKAAKPAGVTAFEGRGSNPASWTNKPKVGDRHNFRITPEALAVLRSMGKNKASWAIRFLAAVWVELPLHLSKDLIEQISDRAKARVESRDYSVENKETQNEP